MADFISNKASYSPSPGSGQENDILVSLATLRRYSQDQKYKAQSFRNVNIQVRDEQLFHTKESIPEINSMKRRPFMGLSCQNCTFTSRRSLVKATTEKLALINLLNNQISTKTDGFFSRTFPHLCKVIGLKTYKYPEVAKLVLKNERVQKAIKNAAVHQCQNSNSNDEVFYQEYLRSSQNRAVELILNVKSTLYDFFLRYTFWILYKLLPCCLRLLVVHPGQLKMLKESSKLNLPIIFLPLHKSHLDYILLNFILLNNDVRSPLMAAGDNLRMPFFGSLSRGLRTLFNNYRIDSSHQDYIYKAVLHTYINLCLTAGHNVEMVLEGGRTLNGKPCMPKSRLLNVIVELFMDGTIEDALLVPMSFSYEKLAVENFLKEQSGKPDGIETFSTTLKEIWHVLNSDLGTIRVDFNQPFSLRELIKTFEMNKESLKTNDSNLKLNPTSLYGIDEHKTLVDNISKHIIYDCAQSSSVMSTNALAFLLLTKFRDGTTLEKLANALKDLKHELEITGTDVGFSGDLTDVINYAVDLLGPTLVKKEKLNNEDIIKPITILPNVIDLSCYSNSLVDHFALESVVALALSVSEIRIDTVSHDELLRNTIELCDVLQYEFLFCKPCQALEQVITSTIEDLMIRKEIFIMKEDSDIVQKSRKLAAQLNDEENEIFEKRYQVNKSERALENRRHLEHILMPFIETYALTAWTLDRLIQRELLESELIGEVLNEMKKQLNLGLIKYADSIVVDCITNGLRLYQKWDILECHLENQLLLYYLKDTYDNTKSVRNVYNKINKYRKNNSPCAI